MELSHISKSGELTMVDISSKPRVKRTALATGHISMKPETIGLIKDGIVQKGDALACARVAGITGAKKTSDLIPLCHNIAIDTVAVDFEFTNDGITVTAKAVCTDKTGLEMEALTAVSLATLTLYDMCKAADKEMVISNIRLVKKQKEVE